jgi:hypothetical protein
VANRHDRRAPEHHNIASPAPRMLDLLAPEWHFCAPYFMPFTSDPTGGNTHERVPNPSVRTRGTESFRCLWALKGSKHEARPGKNKCNTDCQGPKQRLPSRHALQDIYGGLNRA